MKAKMKLEDKVGLGVLIMGISFILIYPYYQWTKLGEIRYTIGVLNGIDAGRGGWKPNFYFTKNEVQIHHIGISQSIVTPENIKKYINKKYYVVFSVNNERYIKLLIDYPVPDSIQNPPPFGWDSIPGLGELEIPFVWDGGKSPPIKKK